MASSPSGIVDISWFHAIRPALTLSALRCHLNRPELSGSLPFDGEGWEGFFTRQAFQRVAPAVGRLCPNAVSALADRRCAEGARGLARSSRNIACLIPEHH